MIFLLYLYLYYAIWYFKSIVIQASLLKVIDVYQLWFILNNLVNNKKFVINERFNVNAFGS